MVENELIKYDKERNSYSAGKFNNFIDDVIKVTRHLGNSRRDRDEYYGDKEIWNYQFSLLGIDFRLEYKLWTDDDPGVDDLHDGWVGYELIIKQDELFGYIREVHKETDTQRGRWIKENSIYVPKIFIGEIERLTGIARGIAISNHMRSFHF